MYPPEIPQQPNSTLTWFSVKGVVAVIIFLGLIFVWSLVRYNSSSSSSPTTPPPNYLSLNEPPQQQKTPERYPCDPTSVPGLLCQARLYMKDPMSDYDAKKAVEILQQVPRSSRDEYGQAQEMLADIKHRPKIKSGDDSNSYQPTATPEPVFPDDLIRRKLARDYPDDYVTQKGVYDMQVEAFDYMKRVPPSRVKSKVQRDYPNDFVTQKGVYDMQIEAKEQMRQP